MWFLVTLLVVVGVVHYYLWRRLVRATTLPGTTARRALTWTMVGLAVLVPITLVGGRLFGSEFGHIVAWPGYMWVAIMFYLLVFLLALEIPRAVAVLAVRSKPSPAAVGPKVPSPAAAGPEAPSAEDPSPEPPSPEVRRIDRRMFISRTAAAVAGVGALATVGYGVRTALGDPVIERVPVRLPRLDPRMNGLRVAVVSDIHLGPLTGVDHTQRIVRMINGLEADVVTIVGDLVDGTVAELGPLAAPLKSLESRYGAYFVTGNHEYYTANGPQEWVEELNTLGIRSLRNERVEIRHAGAVLDLAGVNDLTGQTDGDGPDLGRALGGRDTARPVILLAHQPLQAGEAAGHGVDLQLSGHTHGGQMVPFNLIVPLQQPVVRGLATIWPDRNVDAAVEAGAREQGERARGTQVYVTRGAGFWGPPVRVGAPPEITLLDLRA